MMVYQIKLNSLNILIGLLAIFVFVACNSGNSEVGEMRTKIEPEITFELTPTENNPRNSEGDFITLKDGAIMFVYSHFYGDSRSDFGSSMLAARYSDDGGNSWSDKDDIVIQNEGGVNVMSVSLLRLQDGRIALFYVRKNSMQDCIPILRYSEDEGKSWSDAIPTITDREGYFVLNNDRVIQLKDGRLMMAVSRHSGPGKEWTKAGKLYTYYSDNNGQTWTSSEQVPNNTDIWTQEPGLIEMQDGRIMMFSRATGGFQQLSYSSDRGQTWSHIETSNIPSPRSPATIERIPSTGDWILVWNNNPGPHPDLNGKRTPLTVAVSEDEGKSWKYIKNIEDDPDGWYCYTAIYFPDDENILLGYCAGNKRERTGLAVSHLTRLKKEWLYEN